MNEILKKKKNKKRGQLYYILLVTSKSPNFRPILLPLFVVLLLHHCRHVGDLPSHLRRPRPSKLGTATMPRDSMQSPDRSYRPDCCCRVIRLAAVVHIRRHQIYTGDTWIVVRLTKVPRLKRKIWVSQCAIHQQYKI